MKEGIGTIALLKAMDKFADRKTNKSSEFLNEHNLNPIYEK
jgi:hypothetical protein